MAKDPDYISLDKIRQRETPERSIRWYQNMIRSLGLNQVSANDLTTNSDLGKLVSKPVPGTMYLFQYDPKTKDYLPYYDTSPLVVPFRSAKGGFYGMNFHYLPPLMRMQVLGRLMDFSTTGQAFEDTTTLKLKWSVLNQMASFPTIEFAVKRYLYSHVQSRFLQINPKDWKKAIVLPTESFVKATKNKVFADARRAK